jgi:hypothetical protein
MSSLSILLCLWLTSIARGTVFPGVAGLAVDVRVLAVAQVSRAEGLLAGVAGGALTVVSAVLNNHLFSMEHLEIFRYFYCQFLPQVILL